MNDIVIPYLKNNSGELETCVELIKKNVPHRNIYVVEDYEPSTSFHAASHINQILKLKWAIENLDITDQFYLFNDDFFVLEPVTHIPYYHKGTLDAHLASRFGGTYTAAIRTTRDLLGGEALSYEMHLPFLFDKKRLYGLIQELAPLIDNGSCPLIRSTYGNRFNVGGEYMKDVKIDRDFEEKTYLSTTETSFRRGVGKYIRSKL